MRKGTLRQWVRSTERLNCLSLTLVSANQIVGCKQSSKQSGTTWNLIGSRSVRKSWYIVKTLWIKFNIHCLKFPPFGHKTDGSTSFYKIPQNFQFTHDFESIHTSSNQLQNGWNWLETKAGKIIYKNLTEKLVFLTTEITLIYIPRLITDM